MRILSLDLGTATGWAISQDEALTDAGTWKLATEKEIALAGKNRMSRRLDPRIPAFWEKLRLVGIVDWIVFEDVQFSSVGTQQTQLWSSFRGVVWAVAYHFKFQVECLGVQKLKQFATGHGGATKEMMAKALWTGTDPRFFLDSSSPLVQFHGPSGAKSLDDNAVDAVHLLRWAIKTLKVI